MSNDDDTVWDQWFDAQYPLSQQLDLAVAGLSLDQNDAYRAALWSSVIEHAAEMLRINLHLASPEDAS